MGTGSFQGVKCGRGVLLTTHPLLVPRSWKSRAIPLPTLGSHRACNGITLPLPLLKLYRTQIKIKCIRMSETDKIHFELDQRFSSVAHRQVMHPERMLRTALLPWACLFLPIFLFSFLFIPFLLHTSFIPPSFDLPPTNKLSKLVPDTVQSSA